MRTEQQLIGRLVDAAVQTISDNWELLTDLDRAIGDGDHGVNMRRGFAAIDQERSTLVALSIGQSLERMGNLLVLHVGGAAGPLYGSLLLAMGGAAQREPLQPGLLGTMLASGVAAVKRRGRSERGEKTMLDVLVPVEEACRRWSADEPPGREVIGRIRQVASEGLESTRALMATKGRASYLRERSIGHLDPGAYSSYLLVKAVCDVIQESP